MDKPRILIVDDRIDGRIALEAVLRSEEYNLDSVGSGEEALARTAHTEYAIVVLDVQMPGMDGFEVARRLRDREKTRELSILFVTAINKDSQFVEQGYASGAVDYIFKPFEPYVLRAKVEVFVALYEKERRLRKQAEELRRAQRWSQILIDSARDIIATTTTDGVITSLSPAFEKITGFERKPWIGRLIETSVHRNDLGILLYNLQAAAAGREQGLFETRVLTNAGEYVTLESSIRVLEGEGREREVLWIARDITERKKAEAEVRRRAELERSNKELEQFAYICSHDLQEPLRVLLGYSQLLKRQAGGALDASSRNLIDTILGSAERMLVLIRELLEFSRLDHPTRFEALSLREPIQDAIAGLAAAIDESNANVVVEAMPNVLGNRSQIARVFQNLLANALKFRGEEAPRIVVSARQSEDKCVISIRDNGIGFDMKYASAIFDVFRRLHRQDEYRGTGMGLSICKRIIERHGGKIWAESFPFGGSTFFFSLDTVADAVEDDAAHGIGISLPTEITSPMIHIGKGSGVDSERLPD